MELLKTHETEEASVVEFRDSKILDEARIQEIGEQLLAVAERAVESKGVVVSFAEVEFMSSAMIGKLVLLNKKCKSKQIPLKLCDITGNVSEVFEIMQLHKVLDIYKTREKAMKSFEKKGWFG